MSKTVFNVERKYLSKSYFVNFWIFSCFFRTVWRKKFGWFRQNGIPRNRGNISGRMKVCLNFYFSKTFFIGLGAEVRIYKKVCSLKMHFHLIRFAFSITEPIVIPRNKCLQILADKILAWNNPTSTFEIFEIWEEPSRNAFLATSASQVFYAGNSN